MCRRLAETPSDWLVVAALLVAGMAALAPTAPAAAADPTGAYLESLGLDDLLAVSLEQRLASVPPDARGPILERLSGIYARLLDAEPDGAARDRLLARARTVVREGGGERTERLELAIARAGYRIAERIAERHRIRAAEPEEIRSARDTLMEIDRVFHDLEVRVNERIRRSKAVSDRAATSRALAADAELDEATALRDELAYLAGWTAYYRQWLEDPTVVGESAEPYFKILLDFGDRGAVPIAVRTEACSDEIYARSLLGLALSRGLNSGYDDAISWINVLAEAPTHASVAAELDGWRLAIQLEFGRWTSVRDALRLMDEAEVVSPAILRMIAARALEAGEVGLAPVVAREAVGELGQRGELAQIHQLARRYGTGGLGREGFLVAYVRAVDGFTVASESIGREPATSTDDRKRWSTIAETFDEALASRDVAEHETASADATRLLGWSWWYAADAVAAWSPFARAAELVGPAQAAECLWMAIVALDAALKAGPDATLQQESDRLVDVFLERFPGDPNAPVLRARRIVRDPDAAGTVDLESLLSLPRDHPQWRYGRETAAAIFLRQFRLGRGDAIGAGRRYLEVAAELFARDADPPTPEPDADAATVDRARLMLQVALDPRLLEIDHALAVLTRVNRWRSGGWDAADRQAELDYRGVQWAIAAGRWDEAVAQLTRVADADPAWSSRWRRAALARVLAAARPGPGVDVDVARQRTEVAWPLAVTVLEAAPGAVSQVVAATTDETRAAREEGLLPAVAEAVNVGWEWWNISGDRAVAETTLDAVDAVRERYPNERVLLRATGQLAGALGRSDQSLEAWRTLSDGLSAPSPAWYEARYELIRRLAEINPERARRVMQQHVALEPEYGPSPWRQRLRRLHEQLRAERPTDETVDDDATGGSP
ncbi:MAG: hypothetical protein AB8G96_11425 [Phycisphaerales bacterium]